MSEEKQIEEMARVLCPNSLTEYCASGKCTNPNCLVNAKALEALYKAGYRKQIGWISVEERLPERNGRYLTHCKIEGQSLVCILYYCNVGGFNEGTVTHWMPLPEPPKGE